MDESIFLIKWIYLRGRGRRENECRLKGKFNSIFSFLLFRNNYRWEYLRRGRENERRSRNCF